MKKEKETTDMDRVREVRNQAAVALVKYLDTFHPENTGSDSKHSLMGPVGKLLARITTTGDINWDAVKGYILNIHKNQQSQRRGVPASAAERLDTAIDLLKELKELLPPTKWLKAVEDIDDEVFFSVYKQKLVGQRLWIQKKFHEWLKKRFSSIDEINKYLDPDEVYDSFDEMEDPFSLPVGLKPIVDEFWTDYKKGGKEE